MFADDFAPLFETHHDLDALAFAQCNTLGRWPILPLSATFTGTLTIPDGLSDDSSSPITPLDAFNLNAHNLYSEQQDPFGTHCLPMSALYMPPAKIPLDVETASTTDSSVPESEVSRGLTLTPVVPPIVPSQAASAARKRSATTDEPEASPPAKKPRTVNTRVRAKDFVPPDVSGLSKREARLVKNRAAAFLSRQRKREEFESMEIRLAELERENADLRQASLCDPSEPSDASTDKSQEAQLASLRRLLQSSHERENSLKREVEDLRRQSPSAAPSPDGSTASGLDEGRASMGVMAMLSLSSIIKQTDCVSSWLGELSAMDTVAFCDSVTGLPEMEVSAIALADGKLRVAIRRPDTTNSSPWAALDSSPDTKTPKRVRLALSKAQLGENGADLEVEVK